jgi:hypothetical protein
MHICVSKLKKNELEARNLRTELDLEFEINEIKKND